jgi:alpha-maltose-1-phosphate synthase
VVADETGLLVDLTLQPGTFEPTDPAAFSSALAAAINRLGADPELRARMGRQARRRVLEQFSWDAIAATTLALYRTLR